VLAKQSERFAVARSSGIPDSYQLIATWRGCRGGCSSASTIADPFAVNPVRRSFALVSTCALVILVPWLISDEALTTVMLAVGWLAVTGLAMGIPILIWSVVEACIVFVRARRRPPVDQLEISPRVLHVLRRHGYLTIESVETASDPALMLLSNMDTRGLQEVRRAATLWRYRRWQERGFPAGGA
jgi:hypothetical protein